MANTILFKADSRGRADHGWLKSFHTFSFAGYHNPNRMHFGALRVLNDDYVAAGNGFGTHPHSNMEIISIPLEGVLAHKDSMGNNGVIRPNEIQVMSAGSGVEHSEFNGSDTDAVKFLQIWLFPNKDNVTPRYDQIQIDPQDRKNKFQQIVSPNPEDAGTWIHQDAWFHLADIDQDKELKYSFKGEGTGLYLFVLEGEVDVLDHTLSRRDAIGITDVSDIIIKATTATSLLLMEVPMY
ncbi:pirin family protein [Sphingobacterium rhinopitheci]|uniref:pirin family protein n=1 Tax=Sphingobacterium rhinopitheci TaxID=2781960 RepID=UPI001F52B466|nr:pirin family protein [Sphingobacterium rhinopitheci]MCI0920180.1 pirin family protein [Sphingobacterium rhinopitheci]